MVVGGKGGGGGGGGCWERKERGIEKGKETKEKRKGEQELAKG